MATTSDTGIVRSQLDLLMDMVMARRVRFAELLPKPMSEDRFFGQIRLALLRQPALQKCTPQSIIDSCLMAADLGLDPSGRLGSAYLIPYKDTCQLIPGYRGLIDLACRSGLVRSVNAYTVFEKDQFTERRGFTPVHIPYQPRPGMDPNPGKPWAYWCRVKYAGGTTESEVMYMKDILAVKARSPGARSEKSPWNGTPEDFDEMAKKTVMRRTLKKSPLSPQHNEKFAMAMELGDREEGYDVEGQVVDRPSSVDVPDLPAPQTAADALKKELEQS